ncbi:spore germination protein (amino acid permease) [Acetivibrio thermocellus AD2]|jgi:spore germination protein|uniref:Spore germination protein (Amino acid permease) n=1 Tax=Acetivibrio thermocellus AD2 TaxID=1138384 RepID=A0AB36TJI0_ACETH|nr:GerAB/ArcD/ProY family transporter [Acetivibrio thermocellus]CDG36564.1 spore germination protein [Acetivibrio thermocellus BC1]ADU75705.1 spore germination protein [Acetivibrio thermocellus DSM 1313]ALX09734.1 spore germination protein [Acetivibrio thermocellus AD2]ANV77509.1 spore germination protein [Acetivibrio thermocellus DSM 2360]EIC03751.1 spore germination protein [Acetivibrio thermocellus YS]
MENDKLLPVQIMPIVSSTMMGVSILTIQRSLSSIAKGDAWISMILGVILGVFSAIFLYNLLRLNPGLDLAEIIVCQAGNWVGRLFLLSTTIYILIDIGLSLKVFSFALKNFLLDYTPISVVSFLLIIVIVSVVVKGITVIAGVTDILYPFFVTSLVVLIAMSTVEFQKANIMPIIYGNIQNTFKGSLPAFGAISGYGASSYVMKYVTEPKKAFKWFFMGFGISSILYILLTLATTLVFVPEFLQKLTFPTLFLSKAIEFGTGFFEGFFERLEAFMVLIWIPAVFTSVGVYTFASVRNFSVLFNIKPKFQKYVAYAHIPLLFAITHYIKSQIVATNLMDLFDSLSIVLGFGLTPLLLVLTLINRRRRAKNEVKK